MQIEEVPIPWLLTNATNVSTNGFTAPVPTPTMPSGDGVMMMGQYGGVASTSMELCFFGAGSNTNTFAANVYGWTQQQSVVGNSPLWVPVLLATFNEITLDAAFSGVAGSDVPADQMFASACSLVIGNTGISVEVLSPGPGVGLAHVVLSVKGQKLISILYSTGGSATSCNALWRRI